MLGNNTSTYQCTGISARVSALIHLVIGCLRRSVAVLVLGLFCWSGTAKGALDINLTVGGSVVVDVGQYRSITVSYSWASLTQELASGKIEVDLPAVLQTANVSDVQVFGSAHTTSTSFDPLTRKVTFTFIDPLPAGSSGSVQFDVKFPLTTADGTLAAINATSSGTGQPNGTGSVTLEANSAAVTNIGMSLWADHQPMLGEDVIITTYVTNQGNTAYNSPVIIDQLPAGCEFVSASVGGSFNSGTNTVTWSDATIPAGEARLYSVVLKFNSPTFSTGQWVTISATGTGTDSLSAPVNIASNTSVQIVAANPAGAIDKWDDVDPVSHKGYQSYYFYVANEGNVPLTNYTVTDDFPPEFIPDYIYPGSDNNGGYSSTINVWYKTTANPTWQTLPGSPFVSAPWTDPYVAVASLGLAPGEVVSSVKYEFASVPVGFNGSWRPRVRGSIGDPTTGFDRTGVAITGLPKTISNTLDVAYTYEETTYTGSDVETTQIMAQSPIPMISLQTPNPTSYVPLQEVTWQLRMENYSSASEALMSPVYAMLLPSTLEYVPGSTVVTQGPLASPGVVVTNNYNGTGRQLLKFTFTGDHPASWTSYSGQSQDWTVLMDVRTRVKAGAPAGTYTNDFALIGYGNSVVNEGLISRHIVDTTDLDGDSNLTEELMASNTAAFTVSTSTAIDSVLWVKGELDAAFNRYPDAGFSRPGGTMQYKLIVSNPGNIPLTAIRLMDILPAIGDVGVMLHSQPRNSNFALSLTAPVSVPLGVTVKYSTSSNPVRTDLDSTLSSPAGAQAGTFSTTPPATLADTKSLLFDFGALVLNPGESREILWTMSVPAGAAAGQVAWNSFAHRSQVASSGVALPPSEPIKVGMAVPFTVGSFVWNDLDNDGVQDPGEPGISGATLQIFKSNGSPALDVLGGTVPSVTSDSNGIYAFSALADGDYYVRVTPPSGYIPTSNQVADPDNDVDTDSNIDLSRSPPSGSFESGIFTFTGNTEPTLETGAGGTQDDVDDNNGNMTVDFGFYVIPDDFGDYSGFADASSTASTTIKLGTAVTDAETVATKNPTATGDDITGTDDEDGVSFGALVQGQTATVTVNRTCSAPAGAYLSAWIDFNNNGSLSDPGEQIISNVLLPFGTTGSLGYSFNVPATAVSGNLGARFRICSISNPGPTGAVGSGEVEDHIAAITPSLSIGNLVWGDTNNNGVKDVGESGLAGALVQLFRPGSDNAIGGAGPAADSQVGSNQTTIASGAYLFTTLPPGKYFVKVTPPVGYITSGTPDTADNADDNDNNGSQPGGLGNPIYSPIIDLAAGAESISDGDTDANTNLTVDFGLWPGLGVGNLVWQDSNNNGIKDPAETGIGGLTVNLLGPSGNSVLATTTTDGSGNYSFKVYTPGSYRVRVTPNLTYSLASSTYATTDNGVDNNSDGDQPGKSGGAATSPVFVLTAGGEPGSGGSTNVEDTIDFGFRGCPVVSLTPTTLSSGNVGAPYSATITASSGVGPYTFNITSGSLPSGLTLSSAGVVSGTTSTSGTFPITVAATDSQGCVGSATINVPISSTPTYDYGDYAPFPTASNFASATLKMGNLVDADASSPANAAASGDDLANTDDEDSVLKPINLVATVPSSVVVYVTNTTGANAYLNAWIDFNRNGVPDNSGEQVAVNRVIASGTLNMAQTISFTTPANASTGFTALRLRLTSAISPTASGAGGTGEVEDFPVNICPTLGFAYGTQAGDLYQIDVTTGVVSPATALPSGFSSSNGAAYAQNLGADGAVIYTTGTTDLRLGVWDRSTGVNNVAGNLGTFGVAAGSRIYCGDYFNGFYYFVINGTDDLWKATITGTSGNYTLVSASKVSDMWSNSAGHGYGDIVITAAGILYAHASRSGTSLTDFFTVDLNQPVPTATLLGNPPYMHNGITFGLDGKLYGGLGVNSQNANWFEVSLINGSSTFLRSSTVSGMSDMTIGACNASAYLEVNNPYANQDFGDYSLVSGASSTVTTNLRMGSLVDADTTTSSNTEATGDDLSDSDDEDGVTMPVSITQGASVTIPVSVFNSSGANAYLNAWIDFNNDGVFDDALVSVGGERLAAAKLISSGGTTTQNITFTVPVGASVGAQCGVRFRLTNQSVTPPTGKVGSGEVEDYLVIIHPALGIGNLVFVDANENGVYDSGEGVSGVEVELYAGTQVPELDLPVQSTFTASDGTYLFEGLDVGTYVVHIPSWEFWTGRPLNGKVSIADGLAGDDDVGEDGIASDDPEAEGISSGVIVVAQGLAPTSITGETGYASASDDAVDASTNLTVDFGFQNPVGVGNMVFIDSDGDGVYSLGEGVWGVLVELYRGEQTPGVDTPIRTQFTDTEGVYYFDHLTTGSYQVYVPASEFGVGGLLEGMLSIPGAIAAGDDDVGENGIDDSIPSATGIRSGTFTLTGDQAPVNAGVESGAFATIDDADDNNGNLTIDLGFRAPDPNAVGLGNLVFVDYDGSGSFDAGEGVANVTVKLFHSGDDPQSATAIATMTTTSEGFYYFGGLTAGSYFVHIPASQFQVGGALNGMESLPGSGGDFGLDDEFDENGVDSPNPSQTGISSDVIALSPDTEPTDFFGEYGAGAGQDIADDNNSDLTVDLGFFAPLAVGNLVFYDQNGNGVADAGEGVSGVMVKAYPSWANPLFDDAVGSAVTDSNGRYLISDLAPGSYFLYISDLAFTGVGPLVGAFSMPLTTTGDDNLGEDGIDELNPEFYGVRTADFTLAVGALPTGASEGGLGGTSDDGNDSNVDLTIDFGFTGVVSIGNLIYVDTNGNGLDDDSAPLSGALVELFAADGHSPVNDITGNAVQSQITDVSGLYEFTNLPSGTYVVRVTPSNNYLPTTYGGDPDNDVDGDSNGQSVSGQSYVQSEPVTLTAGGEPVGDDDSDPNSNNTVDFGFIYSTATFAAWRNQHPLGGNNAPGDNPDGDGYSNLLEFVFHQSADSGIRENPGFCAVKNSLTGKIDVQVTRAVGLTGVTMTLQGIADLSASPGGWAALTGLATAVTSNGDGTETEVYYAVSDAAMFALSSGGNVRLKVDADTDGNASLDTTVYSGVYGWHGVLFTTQVNSFSMPYLKKSVFGGTVGAVTGNALDVGAAVGTGSLLTVIVPGTEYYAEVVSGDNAGHRFEVNEVGTTAQVLALVGGHARDTQGSVPTSLEGDRIVVRPHQTMDEVLPVTLFGSTNNPATADRVMVHTGTAFESRWLYRNGTSPKWVLTVGPLTSQGTRVMDPTEGLLVQPKVGNVTVWYVGEVRANPFACPLRQGLTLMGSGWPVAETPGGRLMTVAGGFTGTASSATADRISIWKGDTTYGEQGYTAYYLLNAGSLKYWTPQVGTLSNNNNVTLFQPFRSLFMTSRNGHSSWVMPVPWTP